MAGYHAIVNGSTIPVYSRSNCEASSRCGDLYGGEVFTYVGRNSGYTNVSDIRFLNPSGSYTAGFIDRTNYGNLIYAGTQQSMTSLGTCYAFRLRRGLNIVSNSGAYQFTLGAGNMVYTTSATAGETNKLNMAIIGYNRDGNIVRYSGFATLNYTAGSMFASNFCLMR